MRSREQATRRYPTLCPMTSLACWHWHPFAPCSRLAQPQRNCIGACANPPVACPAQGFHRQVLQTQHGPSRSSLRPTFPFATQQIRHSRCRRFFRRSPNNTPTNELVGAFSAPFAAVILLPSRKVQSNFQNARCGKKKAPTSRVVGALRQHALKTRHGRPSQAANPMQIASCNPKEAQGVTPKRSIGIVPVTHSRFLAHSGD